MFYKYDEIYAGMKPVTAEACTSRSDFLRCCDVLGVQQLFLWQRPQAGEVLLHAWTMAEGILEGLRLSSQRFVDDRVHPWRRWLSLHARNQAFHAPTPFRIALPIS